jgi:predicted Na+-dependent transporter
MMPFLRKRWFLLLLLGGVGLALCRPEWLRPGTGRLNPRALVTLALFLMAWTLESRSLWGTVVRPAPAAWAALVSYGPLPALAWAAGRLLPETDFRVGLMVIASVPCTPASSILWTRMAGGNPATALLVVLVTMGTSWLVTPAWLAWATGSAAAVDTGDMMRQLVLVLIVPVGLGQLARAVGPLARTADRCKGTIGVASQLLICGMILKAAVDVHDRLGEGTAAPGAGLLLATAGLCVGTHLAALAGGFWGGKAWGFARTARIAVAFASSQKTLPVALFLFERYFKNDFPLAVVPIALYHVSQLVVDTFIADILKGHRPEQGDKAGADTAKHTAAPYQAELS